MAVNALFPVACYVRATWAVRVVASDGWGAVEMPKRFVAFMRGDPDAVPGDYLLAIVAVFGIIFAIMARALY